MSKITNDAISPVWHGMLYSCAHMAAVGVKGLTSTHISNYFSQSFCGYNRIIQWSQRLFYIKNL